MTPADLKARLAATPDTLVVDVRGADEVAYAPFPAPFVHIPLADLPARFSELPAGRPIVTLCHHGVRSRRAADFLISQGFLDVDSLDGGVDLWSLTVDPALPRY